MFADFEIAAVDGLVDIIEPIAAGLIAKAKPGSKIPGYMALVKKLLDETKKEIANPTPDDTVLKG
jgi:hypothetical protein